MSECVAADTRNAIRDAAKKLLQTLVDSVPEMLERHVSPRVSSSSLAMAI